MSKIFDTNDVVVLKVDEDDLMSFLLKMDIDDMGQPLYPLELFTEELISVIPEYVFAEYETSNITQVQVVQKLREAAKSIYKIKEYDLMRKACLEDDDNAKAELDNFPFKKRGEFGELLLHFLLRDFKGTIPLISKVYFKDSSGIPAHGFDAVHISPTEEILWLGESKLYTDAKQGLKALITDLDKHLTTNYLNDQLQLYKDENDKFKYKVHTLTREETTYLNHLIMNEAFAYIGLKTPSKFLETIKQYNIMAGVGSGNIKKNLLGFVELLSKLGDLPANAN